MNAEPGKTEADQPLIGLDPKFIFVHIPKAAGSSVRNAFHPYTRQPNPIARFFAKRQAKPGVYGNLHIHSKAREYRATLGPAFEEHFVFTLVRNPFALMVSSYHYIRRRPNHDQHAKVSGMDFASYVEDRCRNVQDGRTQFDFTHDADGTCLVDYVGHVESIADSIAAVNAKLGTTAEIGHVNQSRHDAVAAHFTAETQEMVAEGYRRDFETFGYDTTLPQD